MSLLLSLLCRCITKVESQTGAEVLVPKLAYSFHGIHLPISPSSRIGERDEGRRTEGPRSATQHIAQIVLSSGVLVGSLLA
ncbi:unnamed protein product [Vitrella brassicaformis CCMP3155]|uniref:Uncharacterized protein n=1 Tax=Vitrella brassicaformis (strain CCMP3155) TaxID=1169540 RepID=A0A0G4GXN2_VITBC|nr:unnamed protein product [Vitrella brassicaformis CCMP3155]|eukprot:CEM35864.1 unnamed protein product [Vitrella brassicaformis CCMP3155]